MSVCSRSRGASWLDALYMCVCVERIREDVLKGGRGGKVSGDTENVLKDGKSGKETESVAGRKTLLPPYLS